jgi:aminoglycoside phosphotransferase (APT) family kinase protein
VRGINESFIDKLAELHRLDYRAAGLADLGRPEGYVRRQVEGWTRRYADARTVDIPEVEEIAAWLAERIPAKSGTALLYNDYKLDNVVLDAQAPTRVIGVLDWEMSTLGDPLMDLGTALSYWVEEKDSDEMKMVAFGPTMLPGSLTRGQLLQRYAEQLGRTLGTADMLFYYCFALFKTVGVAQQIYARYKQGLTKDERFAMMIVGVQVLARAAMQAALSGRF